MKTEMKNNISLPLCNINVSLLLKRLGFLVPTDHFYKYDENKRITIHTKYEPIKGPCYAYNHSPEFVSMPSIAVALEWLRVNFDIHIHAEFNDPPEDRLRLMYAYEIVWKKYENIMTVYRDVDLADNPHDTLLKGLEFIRKILLKNVPDNGAERTIYG